MQLFFKFQLMAVWFIYILLKSILFGTEEHSDHQNLEWKINLQS